MLVLQAGRVPNLVARLLPRTVLRLVGRITIPYCFDDPFNVVFCCFAAREWGRQGRGGRGGACGGVAGWTFFRSLLLHYLSKCHPYLSKLSGSHTLLGTSRPHAWRSILGLGKVLGENGENKEASEAAGSKTRRASSGRKRPVVPMSLEEAQQRNGAQTMLQQWPRTRLEGPSTQRRRGRPPGFLTGSHTLQGMQITE